MKKIWKKVESTMRHVHNTMRHVRYCSPRDFFFHTASCAPCMKACTPHMLSVKNQATRPQHVSIYAPQACCVWIFFLFKAYLHLEIFIQQLRSS